MKRIKWLLVPFLVIIGIESINAQQRIIVLQHDGEASVFSDVKTALNDAYLAAVDGDTLYLPGGTFANPTEYNKKLTIYGAGVCPDSTAVTSVTYLSGDVALNVGASGSHFEGLQIVNNIRMAASNIEINNVTFARCMVNGAVNLDNGNGSILSNGLVLINNVHYGTLNLKYMRNAFISNCFLIGAATNSYNNTYYNNYFSGSFGRNCYYSACDHYCFEGDANIIYNNIFNSRATYGFNGTGNIVHYNIFTKTGIGHGTNGDYLNNTEGVNLNELFVNISGDNYDGWNTFSFANDYHLNDASSYIGSDSKEIGIYGGMYPWREGLMPKNPHIRANATANSVDEDGNLQVNITVGAQ